MPRPPNTFRPLAMSMTRPFGWESANGPTNGARTMYAPTKNSCSNGAVQAG